MIRTRAQNLVTKFVASPVLPVLGWTKVVESIVAGGPTVNWGAYAVVVTVLWVFADQLREAADDVVEEATE